MILERQPSDVVNRESEWLSYDSAESVEMIHGQKLHLQLGCDYSKSLYIFRRAHVQELLALARLDLSAKEERSPGGVCIDVGANIGYVTKWLGLRSDVGRILAFEPNPAAFEVLQRNVADCPRTATYNVAVWSTAGTVSLNTGQKNSAQGRVMASAGTFRNDVPAVCLDDFQLPNCVTLLKIDVQGGESEVLEGAQRVISESRPILWLEHTPFDLDLDLRDLHQTLEILMRDKDYVPYRVDRYSYLRTLSASALVDFEGDLFLLPRGTPIRQ